MAEQEGELQELVHALETEVRRLLAEIEELTKEDPAGCLAEALRLITAFLAGAKPVSTPLSAFTIAA